MSGGSVAASLVARVVERGRGRFLPIRRGRWLEGPRLEVVFESSGATGLRRPRPDGSARHGSASSSATIGCDLSTVDVDLSGNSKARRTRSPLITATRTTPSGDEGSPMTTSSPSRRVMTSIVRTSRSDRSGSGGRRTSLVPDTRIRIRCGSRSSRRGDGRDRPAEIIPATQSVAILSFRGESLSRRDPRSAAIPVTTGIR